MSKINYQLDSNTTFLTADVFNYPSVEKTLILPSYSTVIERVIYSKALSSPNIHAGLNIYGISGETINFQTSNFMSSMYSVTLQALPDAAGGNWGILNRYPDLLNNPAYQANSISSSVNININRNDNNSLLFVNVLTSSKTIVLPKISDISPSISTSYTYTIKDLRGAAGVSTIYLSTSGGDILDNYNVPNVALNDAFASVDLIAQPNKNQWLITNYYSGQLTDTLSLEYPFYYTGADQRLVVPGSVTYFRVFLWGAGGGYSGIFDTLPAPYYGAGGGGGYTTGILPVTPGEILTIMVGGGSGNQNADPVVIARTSNLYTSNYGFIYGGGGPGNDFNFRPARPAGGGRSAIFRGTTSANLSQELCTAGGGGGGGIYSRLGGGAGGGLIGLRSDGLAETSSATVFVEYGGDNPKNVTIAGGGGQNVGGQGANFTGTDGQRGQAYQGYLADACSGGGGYYGGGTGRSDSGSGGGSGYIGGLIGGYTESGRKNIPGGVNISLRPSYVGYGYSPGMARLGHGYVLLKYP